jgi:ubiquinone biosynthesis protein
MLLSRPVQNLNRIRQIINILLKYGFEDIIASTALKNLIPANNQVNWLHGSQQVLELSRWERLRMVVEDLGPTFIKLAQLLSNRPDVFPDALIKQFEQLQDNVPRFESDTAIEIIETETGKKLKEIFSYFDERPPSNFAASIGQVHRAKLLTGEDVVVKVQRPNVQKQVKSDLSLLRSFVEYTENYFHGIGILNPLDIVETFEKSMERELNYTFEARSMEQFRKLYKDEKGFYVPKPYREFSTSKILIIEYISGCKITEVERLESWGLDPKDIAQRGMDVYLKQIFEFGFFHADPHPGNIIIRPNGSIVLIDFGMVGKLMRQQRFAFAGVFISLAKQNVPDMATNLRRLAINSEIDDMKSFENDLGELVEDYVVIDVDEMGIDELTKRLQKIIYKYHLQIPGTVFLILRSLAILEGIGHKLHPEFEALEFIKPYGAKLMTEQFSAENVSAEMYYSFSQLGLLMYNFPTEIKYILSKFRKGELKFNHQIIGHQEFLDIIEKVSNRFIITLLICAILITSALMINVNPPTVGSIFTIPYPPFIGFVIAGVLGLFLGISMWRK